MAEEALELLKPARDQLIRPAAQGEVLHNDDTGMKVLKLEREAGDRRTGVFISGIVPQPRGAKSHYISPAASTRERIWPMY
jgi:hypothetical protein